MQWHILQAVLGGWGNERQQPVIEFQNAQIEALFKKLGKQRVLLTDDQRRLLAVNGHTLGRKALFELTTIVTFDSILCWYRTLVVQQQGHSEKCRTGRPRISQVIIDTIVRFAKRIQHGAMIVFKADWPMSVTEFVIRLRPTC